MNASRIELELIARNTAFKYNIPVDFLFALIQTESNWNQFAMRYERGYLWTYSLKECAEMVGCSRDTMEIMQKSSWSLGQLMGANLYSSLNFRGWCGELLSNPELALDLTGQYINNMVRRQKLNWENKLDVYACYNAGTVRKVEGAYVNASAVRRFEKNLKIELDKI